MQNNYIPNVLVAGDIEKFRAKLENRPARIVGTISFSGIFNGEIFDVFENQRIQLNDEIISLDVLRKVAEAGEFDYIVFTDYEISLKIPILLARVANVLDYNQMMFVDAFVRSIGNSFYSFHNKYHIFRLLVQKNLLSVLDVDSFFLNGQVYIKPQACSALSVECIDDSGSRKFPIFMNVYNRLYGSISECCFRHYNAILLTAERNWNDLKSALYEFQDMTDSFVVFLRHNSPLNELIMNGGLNENFDTIIYNSCINGKFYFFQKYYARDLAIYMVTHRKHSLSKVPEGYKVIHAGRVLSEELGYQGDASGESISELNPYLNEMTAAYWIWKNTSHDYVGIAHYRRFFTLQNERPFAEEKILAGEQALELLQKYDILTSYEDHQTFNMYWILVYELGEEVTFTAVNLTRKMMERFQPDYLETFDYVTNTNSMYKCNMFITRKYIYDSYCQWLFSFILPAQKEFETIFNMEELSQRQKRIFGFISERMLTVWLLKNNLRIYELRVMEKP